MTELLKMTLLGWPKVYRLAHTASPDPTPAATLVEGFVSDKAQALLYYLAITAETQSRTKMTGLLWGDFPEDNARTSLRTALHNLNQLVEPYLDAQRKTIAFNTALPHEIDVLVFQELVRQHGPRHGRAPLTAEQADALRHAAVLYQGDFLEGFYINDAPEFEEWLLVQRERLRQTMLDVLDTLIHHELSQAHYSAAVAYTRRLLAMEPWREEAHRQLMLLLARQGDFNSALRQYELCAAQLADELGVDPMPETSALHQRIQQLRAQPPTTNLPPLTESFFGRQAEMAEIAQRLLLPDCRLITLLGAGGVGKTRLALELATRYDHLFLDRVCYVPLTAVTTPEVLVTAVGQALGVAFTPHQPPVAQLLAHLQTREMLLLLDNGEHLVEPLADLVGQILGHTAEITILLTSRERLNLRTEWLFVLEGLPLPTADPTNAAVALFAHHARRVQRQFDPTAELAAVSQICTLLGGLPLGIELAAAQLASATCAQIAAALTQTLDTVASNWRDVPARHRSLRAVFQQSWQALTPAEQQLFVRLSIFRGGFTAEAATAVGQSTAALLTGLASKSLVQRTVGTPRYAIHEVLRQYAAEYLAADGQTAAVASAHAAHYLRPLTGGEGELLSLVKMELVQEVDNIRVAWQWAAEQGAWWLLEPAITRLHQFYEAQGWFQEGAEQFRRAAEGMQKAVAHASPSAEQKLAVARLVSHHAAMLLRLGHVAQAQQLTAAAAEQLGQLPPALTTQPLIFNLNLQGILHMAGGEFERAIAVLEQCAAVCRRIQSPQLVKPLANLGALFMRQGRYEAGKQVLQEGLPLCRAAQNWGGLGHFLTNLGGIHLLLGELEAAEQTLAEAWQVCEQGNNPHGKVVVLLNWAEVAHHQGAWGVAIGRAEQAIALAEQVHDRRMQARGLKMLAVAQQAQGVVGPAAVGQNLGRGLELAQASASPPVVLDVLEGVAQVWVAQGKGEEARPLVALLLAHPATEAQHRATAERLVAQVGAVAPPADPVAALKAVVPQVLTKC